MIWTALNLSRSLHITCQRRKIYTGYGNIFVPFIVVLCSRLGSCIVSVETAEYVDAFMIFLSAEITETPYIFEQTFFHMEFMKEYPFFSILVKI